MGKSNNICNTFKNIQAIPLSIVAVSLKYVIKLSLYNLFYYTVVLIE